MTCLWPRPSIPSVVVPLVTAILAAASVGRAQQAIELPRIATLGPIDANAPSFRVDRIGTLSGRDGDVCTWEQLTAATAKLPPLVTLHVDRHAAAALVLAIVRRCQHDGVGKLAFAAQPLRGDGIGAFELVLPPPGRGEPDPREAGLVLRLHHERTGVPPESIGPLLQRWRGDAGDPLPSARVTVCGDVSFANLLRVLANLEHAGATGVWLDCEPTAAQQEAFAATTPALARLAKPTADTSCAIDLGPVPWIRVPARSWPLPAGDIAAAPVGLRKAPTAAVLVEGGGAGGRYGGRGGAASEPPPGPATILALQRDGGFGDGPDGDVLATSLVALSLMADGQNARASRQLSEALGWLAAHQDERGWIGGGGPGSAIRHAVATYALVEGYGLSSLPPLRGFAADAITALLANRHADGGFADPGSAGAEPMATAWSVLPLLSAKYFNLPATVDPAKLVARFDAPFVPPVPDGAAGCGPAAAELFCRLFAGEALAKSERMRQLVARLVADLPAAGVASPEVDYFVTYALFQVGGKPWEAWSASVSSLADGWMKPPSGTRIVDRATRTLTLQAFYRYTRLVR